MTFWRKRTERPTGPEVDEAFEPYEMDRPIPIPVLAVAVALATWGTTALLVNEKAIDTHKVEQAVEAIESRAEAQGRQLFAAHCATCHQTNGVGVRGAVPPLDGSDYVLAQPEVIVQILLHGITGPINVAGRSYDGHMPAFGASLADAEIASIASYVRSAWSNNATPVKPVLVQAQRQATAARRQPWSGKEELRLLIERPADAAPAGQQEEQP